MIRRNLIILVTCQLISATGSFVMVSLSGIIGASLAANPAWATVPVSAMVISVAATSVPATMLMQRIGRRNGFVIASTTAAIAVLIAFFALTVQSFPVFVAAMVAFGINMAFTQQYRFAAAESVDSQMTARAIAFVLLGALGGALLGRELVVHGEHWFETVAFGAPMLLLAGLYTAQAGCLSQLKDSRPAAEPDAAIGRPLSEIVRQPRYVAAVLGAMAGYGLMTLIMTATPISMHMQQGHSIEAMTSVIQAHVLAMYAPSLISGWLIERLGVIRMMLAGIVALAGTSVVGLQGAEVMHYWWALVLLGVGWNFLYVGGTTLLTTSYRPSERFRAQAVNEFSVFGVSATASLLAGVMIQFVGWTPLMLLPLPILAGLALVLMSVRRAPAAA